MSVNLVVPEWRVGYGTENFKSTEVADFDKLKQKQIPLAIPSQEVWITSEGEEVVLTNTIGVTVNGRFTDMIFGNYNLESHTSPSVVLKRFVYEIIQIHRNEDSGTEMAEVMVTAILNASGPGASETDCYGSFSADLSLYYIEGKSYDQFPNYPTSRIFISNN